MADVRLPQGDISTWDEDNAGDEIPQRVGPMDELGVTGVKRVSGYIDEEFLPALRGRKAVRVYREMSCNDSMVGALLFTIDKLIREVEWKVLPAEQSEEGIMAQEFLESCMEDMSHSWDDFMGEVLSMLAYGWSWHEIVYKRRLGPWQKDPKKRSKHSDGLIGWRKMPIRAQETMLRWSFDESGGVRAMVQMAPPRYQTTVIPIEKSVLFRTSIAKGNPEGQSLLRTAYRAWYFKKRLEEFEAIGVERDLAGMPVGKVPADYLTAAKGTPQAKTVEAYRKMVRGVRRDENEGLVLPTQYDPDTKQPLFDFELMSSGGTRQFDTNSIINRYEQRILMCVLADFILVGHESTGSYSMHTDKTGIFRAALNAITKAIADTLNRYAVPRLFAVNGWKLDELPRFEPTNVDPPDLAQLASFISSTAGAGMQWFPDPELEKYVREIARLPEMTDEDVDYKRQMYQQQQMMEYAGSQMELLGMKQKAEMTAAGMSPEQAEMASQQPTPEMAQADGWTEQEAELARRQHPVGQEDAAKEEAMMAQQQELEQAKIAGPPPAEDSPADQANFEREQAKAQMTEEAAGAAHGRETEKMTVQEQIAERQHQRELETLKAKEQADEKRSKSKLSDIKRPPPKGPKSPPKKGRK
jgi:hypothetical protein